MTSEDREDLDELALRLRVMLPEEYQDGYEDLEPAPMRSAGLKYGLDGTVAWDEIWGSFCDLAMAGGPPHKGTLLEPGSPAAIDDQPDRYRQVALEICRGITMAADLEAQLSPNPGWVRVTCPDAGMAGWLLRAIVMENVAVRSEGTALDVPAAPHFRLEKEIKNVVTVTAKTCHYWTGHMPPEQHRAIAETFVGMAADSPLVEPAWGEGGHENDDRARLAAAIERDTGLGRSPRDYRGWLGVECASVRVAIWMMRALVVNNILSRREGTVLFVPVNPATDPAGKTVAGTLARIVDLARPSGV